MGLTARPIGERWPLWADRGQMELAPAWVAPAIRCWARRRASALAITCLSAVLRGGTGRSACGAALTIVTWLILPVVICLSQRLSHACLSISTYTVKLRMAH